MLKLGQETTATALGRQWTFGRLELSIMTEFRDWVREQLGDVFATAERFQGKLPADEWLRIFKEAEATAKELESFTMASPVASRFLNTPQGAAKVAQLLLRKHHPDITEDEAFQVLAEIGMAELGKVIKRGTGKVPAKNEATPAA